MSGAPPLLLTYMPAWSAMSMTPTDFTMIFGAFEDFGPGEVHPRDRAAIRLSPQSLRILIETAA